MIVLIVWDVGVKHSGQTDGLRQETAVRREASKVLPVCAKPQEPISLASSGVDLLARGCCVNGGRGWRRHTPTHQKTLTPIMIISMIALWFLGVMLTSCSGAKVKLRRC